MDYYHFVFWTMVKNQDKIPLTSQGLKNLKKEYQKLVEVRRPQVVARMASARTPGDLTEDSESVNAKQELSFVDGRISELEEVINKAMIIDENHANCREVRLGCRITVKAGKDEHIFHLVGEWEADPTIKKISHNSPLGRSLLGRKVGEKVEVEAPAGKIIYTIVKID